jgi:hypothetical protein
LLAVSLLLSQFGCAPAVDTAMADAIFSAAEKYLLDLEYEQAVITFDEAIKIDPKDPRGMGIVDALLHEKRPEDAVQYVKDHQNRDPKVTLPAPSVPATLVDLSAGGEPGNRLYDLLERLKEAILRSVIDGLLALADYFRQVNLGNQAFQLLRRTANEYPGEARVKAALAQLAEVLPEAKAFYAEKWESTAVSTLPPTTQAPATTLPPVTTPAATAKPSAKPAATKAATPVKSKVELWDYIDAPFPDLAKALGCVAYEESEFRYSENDPPRISHKYRNSTTGTELSESFHVIAATVTWTTADIALFGIKPGDAWDVGKLNQTLSAYHYDAIVQNDNTFNNGEYVSYYYGGGGDRVAFTITNGKIAKMSLYWYSGYYQEEVGHD